MSELIFLSHIHEEAELAKLVQDAIENEFSGFVSVFVSSDGKTIPAGSNLLKRIEDGLFKCIGAIYLISPVSVKRNWINFELGAVWIRNSMSVGGGGKEIPTIPFCHSGITPKELPMPLLNLNAIEANNAGYLELAFKSIQTAVGGKGKLKTDFDLLAQKIITFEAKYTFGNNLVKLFQIIKFDKIKTGEVISKCKMMKKGEMGKILLEKVKQELIEKIIFFETGVFKGFLKVNVLGGGTILTPQGAIMASNIEVCLARDLILDFEDLLIEKIKSND
ncbi:MAG: toll/interleukin-1 receptor domain-containing protein [Flavobacteriales bacterium]|nr:toll/interleukin-1 receptor domain-containing protein [Flavobacteriales bacterium]